MQKRLHIFQHVPYENAEHLAVWAKQQNFTVSVTRWFTDDIPPAMTEIDWLIILGGPMNIYQHRDHPWLIREKNLIREAIREKKKIVGICLGAQLIADALGAKVYQNPQKEIGWFPVQWELSALPNSIHSPQETTVFHWHGDTFDLPAGSMRLASSVACLNQAFLYQNHILAFQFHIESTAHSIQQLCAHDRAELIPQTYIQSETQIITNQNHFDSNHQLLESWLTWLAQTSP